MQMVDLIGQYKTLKVDVDLAIESICERASFIGGNEVNTFEQNLSEYLNVKSVITCANGTDAIQLALMALGLKPGDEVLVPSFTFIATAEVIALLGLTPIMVDVDPLTYNIRREDIEGLQTERTKAIVPVHLFGQSCDMEPILQFAKVHDLFVIEDNAQAIGADYTFKNGTMRKTGTMGDIGTTSFFPAKNLGCYGDGGAIFTDNTDLEEKIRMIANHGMKERYYHEVIGVNSRLDAIQAAVLNIKLPLLNQYNQARQKVATYYDESFESIDLIETPFRSPNSTHVFHQYTMRVKGGLRDSLFDYLNTFNIASGIYYPVPMHQQVAFSHYVKRGFKLEHTEMLSKEVLSLPIHTEMDIETQKYICQTIHSFFKSI